MAEGPNRYARRTFAQLGEDIVLGHVFSNIYDRPSGFFLDVGAYHPWHYSNTALLYERGWSGLSVDANPTVREMFETERPRDLFVNCAVAREAGERDFWIFEPGAASTLDPATRDRYLRKGWTIRQTVRVPVLPLRALVALHVPPDRPIDYLNIDVEGLDREVLETFDFENHQPACISIETHARAIGETDNPVRKLLEARGYTFFSHTVITSFFVRLP